MGGTGVNGIRLVDLSGRCIMFGTLKARVEWTSAVLLDYNLDCFILSQYLYLYRHITG